MTYLIQHVGSDFWWHRPDALFPHGVWLQRAAGAAVFADSADALRHAKDVGMDLRRVRVVEMPAQHGGAR